MKPFMAVSLMVWIWVLLAGFAHCQRPESVNIGAVFTFDSVIGRAARIAMNMAISDVNADPIVLNGTKLKLIMEDASCSAFLGSIGGMYSTLFPPLISLCQKIQEMKLLLGYFWFYSLHIH